MPKRLSKDANNTANDLWAYTLNNWKNIKKEDPRKFLEPVRVNGTITFDYQPFHGLFEN